MASLKLYVHSQVVIYLWHTGAKKVQQIMREKVVYRSQMQVTQSRGPEIMCMGMTFSLYHNQMKGPFEVELTALCDTQTFLNISRHIADVLH